MARGKGDHDARILTQNGLRGWGTAARSIAAGSRQNRHACLPEAFVWSREAGPDTNSLLCLGRNVREGVLEHHCSAGIKIRRGEHEPLTARR
jgi:hypothetical protein